MEIDFNERAAILGKIISEVKHEFNRATTYFGSFHNAHEGYAVILEELDELWDEIKEKQYNNPMRDEAIQVAAMAIRFIYDICPERE